MSEGGPRSQPEATGSGTDDIAQGLADLAVATVEVGVAVARSAARATAPGRMVSAPPQEAPLNQLVHYSVATVRNVLALAGIRAPFTAPSDAAPPVSDTTPSAVPAGPSVLRGSTLHVPLSVENPGPTELTAMRFVCESLVPVEIGDGTPLNANSVSFNPEVLTVAARDFEKLTVLVATATDTSPGIYRLTVSSQDSGFRMTLGFSVRE